MCAGVVFDTDTAVWHLGRDNFFNALFCDTTGFEFFVAGDEKTKTDSGMRYRSKKTVR